MTAEYPGLSEATVAKIRDRARRIVAGRPELTERQIQVLAPLMGEPRTPAEAKKPA